jgi:hypothetical protein
LIWEMLLGNVLVKREKPKIWVVTKFVGEHTH